MTSSRTGTLVSLSRLQERISLYPGWQDVLLKVISADLENLTLSDGVKNMSERLPAFSISSDVEYSNEYVMAVLFECSLPLFHEFAIPKYRLNPPAVLVSELQIDAPRPVQPSTSTSQASPPSALNTRPLESCWSTKVIRIMHLQPLLKASTQTAEPEICTVAVACSFTNDAVLSPERIVRVTRPIKTMKTTRTTGQEQHGQ
jgi:hypothetical protein